MWVPSAGGRKTVLLVTDEGQLKKVPAFSKELLMGFKADHTKKLDRELFKKASISEEEDIRQAGIGNSFHTTTVAALLGAILFDMKFLPEARSPDVLLANLVAEHELEDKSAKFSTSQTISEEPAPTPTELLEMDEEPCHPMESEEGSVSFFSRHDFVP